MSEAVLPTFFPDEEADRTEFGRSTWIIGLAREDGDAAELQIATDRVIVHDTGALLCFSLWDEDAELREEPILTMSLAPGTWTYYTMMDPYGHPQIIEKVLGSATQRKSAVR